MKKIPLNEGRIKQKQKTRTVILAAAKRLMKKSKRISLEDIAEEAEISRATIYRYFSTVDLLILEASLDIHHLSVDEIKKEVDHLSMRDRIFFIQEHYNTLAQKNEIEFRRYMSAVLSESVTNKKKVRGARRVASLKKSLEPFKKELSKKEYERLIHIATILMGIDALLVSKDVCGLNNKDSSDLLHWGLDMILKGMKVENL